MLFVKNVRLITGEEIYENGCLLTEKDQILYAGPQEGFTPPRDARMIDGKGGVCMPGLMNAHTHVAMSLLRGVGSDLALMDWLDKVVPLEEHITPEIMYTGAMLGIAEMIRTGTAGFADQYFHVDSVLQAALDAGIRGNICRGSSNFAGVDQHLRVHKEWHGRGDGRIRISVGLHAEYTSDEKIAARAVQMAQDLGAGMQVHVSESAGEVAGCIERHGKTPIAYFNDLGLFDRPVIAAHCVHPQGEDMDILLEKGVYIAHCPASNLKLASGIAPIREYLARGCRVCLGTDGAASNNALDMFREMRLMSLLQKGVSGDATAVDANQAIHVATRAGALAMGYDNCGLLKKGYQADFVLLDGDSPLLWPGHDAAADAVYAADGSAVRMNVVAGKVLYEDGEYTTIDMERLRHDVKAAVEQMKG